ncbi:hypothetical protein B484DRAFT_396296 [Ochromonadaceae sp. CCMP2298]|nr:hypothetical protein B484DRAFT_396296 [Ochromonadaceae sp. CCMP2298]
MSDLTSSETRAQGLSLLRTSGDLGLLLGATCSGALGTLTSLEMAMETNGAITAVIFAYSQQAGQAYTFAYLEASLNDMLFRLFDAACNPTVPVQLPGASKRWAGLMLTGFRALVDELRSPAWFQAFTFRMESQPRTPHPLYRTTKMDRAEDDDERRRLPAAPLARKRPDRSDRSERPSPPDRKKPQSADARTSFFSVLREYKVPLKSGELPKQCDDKCRRLHFAQMPKGSCRTSLLQLAANTSLVSEENREALIAKITANKRIK